MLSVERIERIGESVILYDASLVGHVREEWFDPAHWPGAAIVGHMGGGRGATLLVGVEGHECVLRHYRRGGLLGRFLRDAFAWAGEERTRPFAEFRLLVAMQARGLPVPAPLAARYRRSGPFYRADLITLRLPGVEPLSVRLARGSLDASAWRAIGRCIGRFHREGYCHADLNAHNLQIDAGGRIYLLDFDRGRRMLPGRWQQDNLARLERSLAKVRREAGAQVAPGDWAMLLEGYDEVLGIGGR